MTKIRKTFQYGDHEVSIETGEFARQASGSVWVTMGESIVLVTAVGRKEGEPRDFLPLTIEFEERAYAAGKVPGGFFKREGRPSEKAVLTARLIDRPLRPLFPDGFRNEVQVICTVLSVDPEVDLDIMALLGASAAVSISGIPFNGPVGAARVAYIDGEFVLNPKVSRKAESKLDLVVAGTDSAVLMVESEADCLNEDIMLGAVMYGHEQMQAAIVALGEMKAECDTPSWDWQPPETNETLNNRVSDLARTDLEEAYQIAVKTDRQLRVTEVRTQVQQQLATEPGFENTADGIKDAFKSIEKSIVRGRILEGYPRIDGRDTRAVRPISIQTGILPRVHGSVVFTRGETQAIVSTTLGTERDSQIVDALEGEYKDPFMLHYNFPPYSVGETGRVGTPKRREIGHGKLAKRAIAAVLPNMSEFPYVLRVVSEITESNGSSSMATVCGTSLSLMDAGVKIKAPVAGVAMGLIKDEERYAVLTDILGDEDHLGDMDFKVAGTESGVTALQMDIKIEGITRDIMQSALEQAKEGRLHILGEMGKVLATAREEMSNYAPRIITIRIDKDKIRDVIGKGGVTIRSISEETGTSVDIADDGTVTIASVDQAGGEEARRRIEQITADVEVGTIYDGKVVKLMDFGAFVNILPGRDGLVHISQISNERVQNVSDKLSEGDVVKVKVLEVDKQGRIRLSMKAIDSQD